MNKKIISLLVIMIFLCGIVSVAGEWGSGDPEDNNNLVLVPEDTDTSSGSSQSGQGVTESSNPEDNDIVLVPGKTDGGKKGTGSQYLPVELESKLKLVTEPEEPWGGTSGETTTKGKKNVKYNAVIGPDNKVYFITERKGLDIDRLPEGYRAVKLPAEVYEAMKKSKFSYVKEDGKITGIIFEHTTSSQEWSSGFDSWKTTIDSDTIYNLDGTTTINTEEYLQRKLSDAEKEKWGADQRDKENDDWTKQMQTSRLSVELYKGKMIKRENTYYHYEVDEKSKRVISSKLGSFEINYFEIKEEVKDGKTVKTLKSKEGGVLKDSNGDIKIWFDKDLNPYLDENLGNKLKDWDVEKLMDEIGIKGEKKRKIFRNKFIDDYTASTASIANKISTMGFWRFMGTAVHAFNEYKGIATLSALGLSALGIEWFNEEKIAKRKKQLQEDFCVIGGLKECVSSMICDGYFKTKSKNYIVAAQGPEGIPVMAASIVAERSDKISFKGETRENLVNLFGEYTYINGEKVDFTDPSLDLKNLNIDMWLYHAQFRINNPLDKDLHVNILFTGPDRSAKWFSDWRKVPKGESANKNILKYSTTNYTQVCLLFKEDIKEQQRGWVGEDWGGLGLGVGAVLLTLFPEMAGAGVGLSLLTAGGVSIPLFAFYSENEEGIFSDYPHVKSVFCSPIKGAGPPTSIRGHEDAADALLDQGQGDGEEI